MIKSRIKWLLTRTRCLMLRVPSQNIDSTAYLAPGARDLHPSLHMGPYSYIGPGCLVGPNVTIKAYGMVGPNVSFVGDDHVFLHAGTPIIFSGRPALVRTTVVFEDALI